MSEALFLKSQDLPEQLHAFNKIPHDIPILIKGKKDRLFHFKSGQPSYLEYKNVRIANHNSEQLKTNLWHLQRPTARKNVRFADPNKIIMQHAYGPKTLVESVGAEAFKNALRSFKQQTLVLSGQIKNGRLLGDGKTPGNLGLDEIKKLAAENDINLIMLETEKANGLLKHIANGMNKKQDKLDLLHETTGDFFSRFSGQRQSELLEISVNPSGQSQVAIQYKKAAKIAVADEPSQMTDIASIISMPIRLPLRSITVLRPNRERSEELDARSHPFIKWFVPILIIIAIIEMIVTYYAPS